MGKTMWKMWSATRAVFYCALLIGSIAVGCQNGCKHAESVPTPPESALCDLDDAGYDALSDKIVSALGDDMSWENRMTLLVTENTKKVVFCVVQNVVFDLKESPTETSRAKDWLAKNKE